MEGYRAMSWHGKGLAALVAILLLLAGCGRPPLALQSDAYVWQRQWTSPLVVSMRQSAADIRAWRVLAAQTGADGRLQFFSLDRTVLTATARPVVLVVRIDGQLARWDEAMLVSQVLALRERWRGMALAGLEIDHDCATARLPAYTQFLVRLKKELGDVPLSITALPTWLDSPALDDLLAVPDETVLQVHAVQSPHAGLFDPMLAAEWARRFSTRTHRPFRLALPTYASRVSFDADGRVLGTESEVPNLAGGVAFSELASSPDVIAAFVRGLHERPPAHLVGLVWFRLPTGEDVRAWSLPTWRAVVRGLPLSSRLSVQARAGTVAGALDVILRNDGNTDAALPASVRLPADCRLADGVNGYVLATSVDGAILRKQQDAWLPPRHERVIGWARCASERPELRIE